MQGRLGGEGRASLRIIDISRPLVEGVDIEAKLNEKRNFYRVGGEAYECYAYRFVLPSHRGAYLETSAHFVRGRRNTEDVADSFLLCDASIARLARGGEGIITGAELEGADRGTAPGQALLVHSPGNDRRFFSRDAGAWMLDKGISLIGADLRGYDRGFEDNTGFFDEIFVRGDIPIIAGLRSLEEIRQERFKLLVFPLKLPGICVVPCRIAVLEEEGA